MPVSEDDIRAIALGLPGAFERPTHGARPSFRTKARMFAWIPDDPPALVVWVMSEEQKFALIDAEPAKYFTTPHYDGHAMVLARLNKITKRDARDLVTESWRLRAPAKLLREWDAPTAG